MVAKFKVEYVPGGATLNTVRTAQVLLALCRHFHYMSAMIMMPMMHILNVVYCVCSFRESLCYVYVKL